MEPTCALVLKMFRIRLLITHQRFCLEISSLLQTSIAVKFPSATNDYTLQWKRHEQPWEAAQSKVLKAGTTKAEAEDLEPGTTYCVRLSQGDGDTGPELIIDTEQVGCTPTPDKKCCVVM